MPVSKPGHDGYHDQHVPRDADQEDGQVAQTEFIIRKQWQKTKFLPEYYLYRVREYKILLDISTGITEWKQR